MQIAAQVVIVSVWGELMHHIHLWSCNIHMHRTACTEQLQEWLITHAT